MRSHCNSKIDFYRNDLYTKQFTLEQTRNKPTLTTKMTAQVTNTQDGLPTTPEGFSGAYTGYLKGSVKDPETGKNILRKFADFNEAVVEAIRYGDACGGITRTSKGYSLRAGTEVKTNSNAAEGIEICWVKGDGSDIDASVVTSMIETVTTPPEEEDDEEFQDALSDKVTMIKEEVAQIASNMETLISQIKAFLEKL